MPGVRLLALIAGIALFLLIIKALLKSFFGGPSREEEYRRLEQRERIDSARSSGESPKCPLCGSDTRPHDYPHIRVHRCVEYPDCRGFVKARSAKRPKFARDWEKKRK